MSHWYRRLHWSVLIIIALSGCATSTKALADRHSMSRLWAAPEGDLIYFEATVSPDYPLDSAAAEVVREDWMAQWLERGRLCANGFEVIDRIRIGSAADNPYQHDLRYTLRCTGV
ncbi:MAG: hypothetical protein AB8G17_13215 [Gammaproteobacteria bacterium]